MNTKTEDPVKAVPSLKEVKSDVQKSEKPVEISQPSAFLRRLIHYPDQREEDTK